MNRFGIKFMQLVSTQAQRAIFTHKFYIRSTQKASFIVFALSHDRYKQTHHYFKYKPTKNFHNSQFPYILKLPPKSSQDPALPVESKPDEPYHYTIVWLLGKFFAKLAAIIVGRTLNRSFWSLSPEDRQILLNNIQEHRYIPCTIAGLLFTIAWLYYFSHFELTPITKRARFMSFSSEEEAEIAQFQAEFLIDAFRQHFMSGEDARVKRAVNVSRRIILANPETNKVHKWKIYIINDSFVNAFVLSTGHIFIFKGILNLSSTDDQLAVVLGHEIAHAVLNHGIEGLSLSAFVDWFLMVGFALIWLVIRYDIINFFASFLLDRIANLLIFMPKSRRIEWEADHVGLIFAANACYDVREAGLLFRKIARLQERKRSLPVPAWMETHPDSLKRADYLDSLLSDAEGWRIANGCPPLTKDNRKRLNAEDNE